MPERNPVTLVQALIGAELTQERGLSAQEVVPLGPTVTLSRDFGCGALAVGKLLADRLGVRLFDKELLDQIAAQAEVEPHLMARLDEQVRSWSDDWIHSLLHGKSLEAEDYRRHLVNVVLGISRKGGVIVGRGSHLILNERKAYRVRISSSPSACARRIARNRNISEDDALKEVHRMNEQRREFVRHHFKADIHEAFRYDLVVNADRYSTTEIADLIVYGMELAGFDVKKSATA